MRRLMLVLLLLPFAAFSQQITFEIIYGGEGYDEARSIWQTSDGGYIVAGTSGSYPSGNSDVFLLKIDSVGAIQWFKFPGGADLQAGYSVQQTSDGGYIVAGLTDAGDFGGYDVYLMKTDINGDFLWSKTYGGADWDFGYSVEETSDNGFIIGGTTYSFGQGEQMYMVKTDAAGDTAWTKTFGGSDDENAKCVRQTSDGGYVLVGYTETYGAGMKDVFILKTDADGDSVWAKMFGHSWDDFGTFIEQTIDDGYIVSASKVDSSTNRHDQYYIKTDGNGLEQWHQIFTAAVDDKAVIIHQRNDGVFLSAGTAESGNGVGGGKADYFFLMMNSNGYPIGSVRTEGAYKDDVLHTMQITSDMGIIMAGASESYGDGLTQIYVVKADSILSLLNDPVIIGIDDEITNIETMGVYPNPASDIFSTYINSSDLNLNCELSYTLCDLHGRVLVHNVIPISSSSFSFIIPVKEFTSGLYILSVSSDKFNTQKKIMVHH